MCAKSIRNEASWMRAAEQPLRDVLEWARVHVEVLLVQPAGRKDRAAQRFGRVAALWRRRRQTSSDRRRRVAAPVLDRLDDPPHEDRVDSRVADVAAQMHLDGDGLALDPIADVPACRRSGPV